MALFAELSRKLRLNDTVVSLVIRCKIVKKKTWHMNQLIQVKYNSKKASILRDVKKEKRTETVVEKF